MGLCNWFLCLSVLSVSVSLYVMFFSNFQMFRPSQCSISKVIKGVSVIGFSVCLSVCSLCVIFFYPRESPKSCPCHLFNSFLHVLLNLKTIWHFLRLLKPFWQVLTNSINSLLNLFYIKSLHWNYHIIIFLTFNK